MIRPATPLETASQDCPAITRPSGQSKPSTALTAVLPAAAGLIVAAALFVLGFAGLSSGTTTQAPADRPAVCRTVFEPLTEAELTRTLARPTPAGAEALGGAR